MNNALVPSGNGYPAHYNRPTKQALGIVEHNRVVGAARIEAETELAARRLQAVGLMTSVALQEVATFSLVEQSLAQLVPLAASRLQGIGDAGTVAMVRILTDAANRLA